MSRFTASPFHKPSPFEFPRAPLSPPDTNVDAVGPAHVPASISVAGGAFESHPSELDYTSPAAESPAARFRRATSSLAYHNSGLRDGRERQLHRSVNHKSFVVVIPPPALLQEHGQLGHTLSLGPRHRLSQGLLLPLFPTMYAQLTAIAREFNFPSTAGLCLYLQYTDSGVTVTPRISDESWQFIWSHVFDGSASPTPGRPPICGRVEFDIDLRQARWYAAWIASAHQERSFDFPVSVAPSLSLGHFRNESRTTFADDNVNHDSPETEQPVESHVRSVSTARHVPKKLSLVGKIDNLSIRSGSRAGGSRSGLSPPETGMPSSQVLTLSPIRQAEEPITAKQTLDKKVESWRASASLKATSLAASMGQTSLEPANMPNFVDDDLIPTTGMPSEDEELNMDDFTWSISSAGPNDWDPISPVSWDRVPSVHLAQRAEGSVCLTPSICTSFGPDDSLGSPLYSEYSRPYSPDLAHRMYEDVPYTPTTATSWGPASVYSDGLESDVQNARSIDLGERAVHSPALTVSTATSWGPASYPASPIDGSAQFVYTRTPSVHLADRGEFSRPATPSTATSWGAPLSYPPSPATPFYVSTPDAGHRAFEDSEMMSHSRQRAIHSFPYYDPAKGVPWAQTWPYNRASGSAQVENQVEQQQQEPWKQVWPYVSGANAAVIPPPEKEQEPWKQVWPYLSGTSAAVPAHENEREPWKQVWPYVSSGREVISVVPPMRYPYLDIYPAVYPAFDLYPAAACVQDERGPAYPVFDLYPTVARGEKQSTSMASKVTVTVELKAKYPVFDLYPAVYPHNLAHIYPDTKVEEKLVVNVEIGLLYPTLNLYRAVYPHVVPYPPVCSVASEQKSTKEISLSAVNYPHFDIYPAKKAYKSKQEIVLSIVNYPNFDIYPAKKAYKSKQEIVLSIVNYPNFDIYPAKKAQNSKQEIVLSVVDYPNFDIYPAKKAPRSRQEFVLSVVDYPNFDIYPAKSQKAWPAREALSPVSVVLPTLYPAFNLYPSVYPNFDIYPSIRVEEYNERQGYPFFDFYPALRRKTGRILEPVLLNLKVVYPVFQLYPPVNPSVEISSSDPAECLECQQRAEYPWFDIYPAKRQPSVVPQAANGEPIEVSVEVKYPLLRLYEPVYPALDIYPSLPEDVVYARTTKTEGYPHFVLYPAVRQIKTEAKTDLSEAHALVNVSPSVQYPTFNLYPPVYPFFDLYPETSLSLEDAPVVEHDPLPYPSFNLYPAVYPHFDLYPTLYQSSRREEISLSLPAQYPAFNLYPAVYPNFDLWPTLIEPIMVPYRNRPRKTHAELHELVLGRGHVSVRRPLKTHAQLHAAVFSNGGVSTPSGTPVIKVQQDGGVSPQRRLPSARSLSGSTLRSSVTIPPPNPPPSQGLPPHPARYRMSVTEVKSAPVTESPSLPIRPSLSRSSSLASRPVTARRNDLAHLAPVAENSGISRSASLNAGSLERTQSTSTSPSRPMPRKRDSLVLQRVKAINSAASDEGVTLEALSKFPLPPRPPMPPIPKISVKPPERPGFRY